MYYEWGDEKDIPSLVEGCGGGITLYLRFSRELVSENHSPPSENRRLIGPPPKKISVFSCVRCRSLVTAAASVSSLQLFEHHAVWLEDLLVLSISFDAPIH
jgi:hypothetical protein